MNTLNQLKDEHTLNLPAEHNQQLEVVQFATQGSHKLSKRTLFNLPEGQLLVSNLIVGPGPFDRAFMECVAPLPRREAQWGRILSSGANQRLCYVYVDRDAFLADYINKFSHVEVK